MKELLKFKDPGGSIKGSIEKEDWNLESKYLTKIRIIKRQRTKIK